MGTVLVAFKLDESEFKKIKESLGTDQSFNLIAKEIVRKHYGFTDELTKELTASKPVELNSELKDFIEETVIAVIANKTKDLGNNIDATLEQVEKRLEEKLVNQPVNQVNLQEEITELSKKLAALTLELDKRMPPKKPVGRPRNTKV